MKKTLLFVLLVLLLCLSLAMFSCGKKGDDKNPTDGENSGTTPTPVDPTLKNFSDITFNSLTTTYNGEEQKIEISGELPEGTTVSYTSNTATNAGIYSASVTLSCEGYNTKTLNATLTINKATYDMSGAKWSDTTVFTYDTTKKTVTVSGLPTGVSVKSYNGNTATDAGAYTATVTFDYDTKNYNAPTLASCSWNINKAQITVTVELPSESFEYDAKPHSLAIVGNIPAGTTVSIFCHGIAEYIYYCV